MQMIHAKLEGAVKFYGAELLLLLLLLLLLARGLEPLARNMCGHESPAAKGVRVMKIGTGNQE